MISKTAIFDIDGTLSDCGHRLHFIDGCKNDFDHPKDWDAFFFAAKFDIPRVETIEVLQALKTCGYHVIIVTGRPEKSRDLTTTWLRDNRIDYDLLFMREDGDRREDFVVKKEALNTIKDMGLFNVVLAFDDRQQCVDMYRAEGVRCLQVAKGDY